VRLRELLPQRSTSLRSPLPQGESPPFHLPESFLWGTATAAYQIEHTQDDDWAAFEASAIKEGRFDQLSPGKPKPGHIHKLGDWPEEVRRKKTDFDARIVSSPGPRYYQGPIKLIPRKPEAPPAPAVYSSASPGLPWAVSMPMAMA